MSRLGLSGRLARAAAGSRLTPLLALVGLLLGLLAALITPREEEPQIDVTMVDVMLAYPGATAREVEAQLASPLEEQLARLPGVEHLYSLSSPGQALVTVQFEVGVPRQAALVRIFDSLAHNQDWKPRHFPIGQPLVKARGIDDVPILALTLWGLAPAQLKDLADSLTPYLKAVPGTRDIEIIGGAEELVEVRLDTGALARHGLSVNELLQALAAQNHSVQAGSRLEQGALVPVQLGRFFQSQQELAELVVAVRDGKPLRLAEIATLHSQPQRPSHYLWHRPKGGEAVPALTLTVTKKPGENAVTVAQAVLARWQQLRTELLPDQVQFDVSRNYGQSADDKANTLIHKLIFATVSVVALVLFALGRREALVVGSAVVLTLALILFASWAWGFTLNRVSLFALIFSIGILVDDAIVVVENIHRHLGLGKPLARAIPEAVGEVGGPTILATFTVIAALLPMAFVSGLMGPYMSPIPINASMGMLLSLLVALTLTPWLSRHWLADRHHEPAGPGWLQGLFQALFRPFLARRRNRYLLGLGLVALILAAMALAAVQLVVLKMLPFDNKSEFKLVLDMPEGTSLEDTNRVLLALAAALDAVPEVKSTQIQAGTAAPIGFNGLVRQYYLRHSPQQGDVQVQLVDKGQRDRASHAIATAVRPALAAIASAWGGSLKVVEVPPGPPVLAPLVAEVYGPDAASRRHGAEQVMAALAETDGIVDLDSSLVARVDEEFWRIDHHKAARLGVDPRQLGQVLALAMAGQDGGYLQGPGERDAVPVRLTVPRADTGLEQLMGLTVLSDTGLAVPVGELVLRERRPWQQPIFHKDLQPVVYVTADMAGALDSPLYGLFAAGARLDMVQSYTEQPLALNGAALKWGGEWQITYETFRDMGLAYAVGLVLIYLLVVGHFGSYGVPLVIMAPIPLTLIGIMPGHALLGAQFTATSMIGMIALAGIIVRNSILLVDFIREALARGVALDEAVVSSAAVRAKPILLTALAAMLGAFFILDDPIFNGLAVSLIFGIAISTLLTLLVIPLLFASLVRRHGFTA
ncbi:efflux RND transporter permease subunit [Gallaecimonas sp. GXIMD4217]|uniref:efflux RND transporter permease subunit n=1 Tax=Gallaecimonas sp. GXIMD4217 TaxID=3131927 RepID=UPI00311B1DD9